MYSHSGAENDDNFNFHIIIFSYFFLILTFFLTFPPVVPHHSGSIDNKPHIMLLRPRLSPTITQSAGVESFEKIKKVCVPLFAHIKDAVYLLAATMVCLSFACLS